MNDNAGINPGRDPNEGHAKGKSAEELCRDGAKLLAAGNIDAALSEFTAGLSVTKEPDERGILYYNTAICHARLQRRGEAIGALAEAVKAYPRHLTTIRNGTDFPELKETAEFKLFLNTASEYTTNRHRWLMKNGLAWIVGLMVLLGIADSVLRKLNFNPHNVIVVIVIGGIGGFWQFKRHQYAQDDDSFSQSILQILNSKGDPALTSSKSPVLKCPKCGHDYNLTDYREDSEHIFCANCNAELPRC